MSENNGVSPHEARTLKLANELQEMVKISNESPPVPDKEPSKPKVEKPSTRDESLSRQARDLGLSDKAIESFSSDDALREGLTAIYRKSVVQPQIQQPAKPAEEPKKRERKRLSFDGMELDDGLVKKFREFEDLTAQEYDELHGRYETVVKSFEETKKEQQQLRNQHTISTYMTAANALPEGFRKVFGQQVDDGTPADSPEGKNFMEVVAMAESIIHHYSGAGKTISRKQALTQAAQNLFGGQIEQEARDKVRGELKERSDQHLPRPGTHRSEDDSDQPLSRRDAVRKVSAIFQRAGLA